MTYLVPKTGDRVRITGTMPNDPDPLPIGLTGTVEEVVPAYRTGLGRGQIWVDWDEDADGNKRTLILLTDDPFEVIP